MRISQAAARGFALAATLANDRGAERAAAGLTDADRATWQGEALALAAATRSERARRLAAWTRPVPLVQLEGSIIDACHPRALALLAGSTGRDRGSRWLAKAPAPRAEYRADPGLLRALQDRLAGLQPAAQPEATE